MFKKFTAQTGSVMPIALIALTSVIVITVILFSNSFTLKQNSLYSTESVQATALAEAGIDKAVASLNAVGSNYNGESETVIGEGSYVVTVTSVDANTKKITATGYIPNQSEFKTKKEISILTSKGEGLSFSYGVQAGEGGFSLSGGSTVNGSVYSNGNIAVSGGGRITGDAYVAGGTQPIADQQTDCSVPNCADYIFGKTVSGSTILDVAQSFKPAQTAVLNKVSLKLKKVGSPSNATVRILGDNSNKPNKNSVLASGTLDANLVTGNYGFVDVAFLTGPTLTANTTYWIVIDTSSNTNNYWMWSQDTLGSYTWGSPAWSANWQAGSPVWTAINGDLGFQTYMGGVITSIAGTGSGYINGNAYANTMTSDNSSALQIGNSAYYQTQLGITVNGSACSGGNTHCHPNSTDPLFRALPISQSNIDEWKELASSPTQSGNVTIQWPCTTNLEKKHYLGNVTVQGGCTITADSPVWISGNLVVQGGSTVKLKPEFGAVSGVIVVDGTTNLTGGSRVQGSGTSGSYLTVVSTYSHPTQPAIIVNGGNHSSIIYAGDGILQLEGGTTVRQATAKKINMTAGATLTYESGVENPFYTSGPSGSYSVIKGSYQVK